MTRRSRPSGRRTGALRRARTEGTRRAVALEEDLGRRFGRAAALDELDRDVQIRFAAGETLCERKGIAGFHQHVEAPALDLGALAAGGLDDLGRLAHPGAFLRAAIDEPCRDLFVR